MIGELVQSFYGKKGVYLKQIATKGIFTADCEQYYIKSPKKSLKGNMG